jgi:hypothetical protein
MDTGRTILLFLATAFIATLTVWAIEKNSKNDIPEAGKVVSSGMPEIDLGLGYENYEHSENTEEKTARMANEEK